MYRTCFLMAMCASILAVSLPSQAQPLRSVNVSVAKSNQPLVVQDTVTYPGLQQALQNGQVDFFQRHDLEPDAASQILLDALSAVLEGKLDEAHKAFENLMGVENEAMVGLAVQALVNLLFERGAWDAAANLLTQMDAEIPQIITIMQGLPETSIQASSSIGTRASVGIRGHISLNGLANQVNTPFFFDTGASFTVLSASTADSRDVEYVSEETVSITTSTSMPQNARIGYLKELRVGNVRVTNQPVLVFPDEDMTFELSTGEPFKIEAILGWDVIRHLHVEIDTQKEEYAAHLSSEVQGSTRPSSVLSWMGYPLVRLHAQSGQPLLFGLDTGSANTSITPNIFGKADVGEVVQDTVRIGGIGGFERIATEVASSIHVRLSDHDVHLQGAWTEQDGGAESVFFFSADGVLGIDFVQGCLLEVDPPRSRFAIDCP